jgi:hypothetical protein
MRLICIDAKSKKNFPPCDLTEGNIYTVKDTYYYSMDIHGNVEPHMCYTLIEMDNGYGYGHERFIPCSSIDEKELINENILCTTA